LLEMTMADVTQEQAHWIPPGIANPIGALYAHAYLEQDALIHHVLQGQPPLFASSWSGRTGVAQPQMAMELEWARSLQPDLRALRRYGDAVYSDTQAYLARLTDVDLPRELDLSPVGLGTRTVGWLFSALVAGHINNMTGEISCLKGLQGAKGYPF